MPRYKLRDPEYTAVQFTGSNVREILEELGPGYSSPHSLDLKDAETFVISRQTGGHKDSRLVRKGSWVVVERGSGDWFFESDEEFHQSFELVRRGGRPAKEKK